MVPGSDYVTVCIGVGDQRTDAAGEAAPVRGGRARAVTRRPVRARRASRLLAAAVHVRGGGRRLARGPKGMYDLFIAGLLILIT